jgi:membrane dipeptidase
MREWLEANDLEASEEVMARFDQEYEAEHGRYPYATLDETLDHFDYIVELAGVDHVGIGSDYDGVGDSLPIGLKDVSKYPNLVEGLLRRGYSDEDIKKILGGNLLRVWREVEAVAANSRTP